MANKYMKNCSISLVIAAAKSLQSCPTLCTLSCFQLLLQEREALVTAPAGFNIWEGMGITPSHIREPCNRVLVPTAFLPFLSGRIWGCQPHLGLLD